MKIRKSVLFAGMVMALSTGGIALAKDEVLEADMVALEKAYITPLFFTSAQVPATFPSMAEYKSAWVNFSGKYYEYRPDYANWQIYFDQISGAVAEAEVIVNAAKATCTPGVPMSPSTCNLSTLPKAHDALEAARMTMLELRPKNGFPKFITDKMTVFHEPMETMVLSLKGKTPGSLDSTLLLELEAHLAEAEKAWGDVEKCPVDPSLWGFSVAQMNRFYALVADERARLDAFKASLAAGDQAEIISKGMALKPQFVEAYKMFGNFAKYMTP